MTVIRATPSARSRGIRRLARPRLHLRPPRPRRPLLPPFAPTPRAARPHGATPASSAPDRTSRASPARPRRGRSRCPPTTARTSSTRPSGGTTPATSPRPTGGASASSSRSSAAASRPARRPAAPASPRTRSTSPTSPSPTWRRGATSRPSASRAAPAGWPARPASRSRSGSRTGGRIPGTPTAAPSGSPRATRVSGLSLDLELAATKPLVAHGDRGLSPKSDEPGNASYYVGYTRMAARGRIGAGGDEAEVAGEAWFDHEWSTSALGAGAVGWDWFSLQLDDGRELMHFQIRREDGSDRAGLGRDARRARRPNPPPGPRGRVDRGPRPLDEPADRRPVPLALAACRCPPTGLDLVVEPWLEDQEMRTSFVYWEGAVRVSGACWTGGSPRDRATSS